MIAESTSRLVSGFVDAGVLVVFLPLLVAAVLLARPTARALGTGAQLAALALASLAGILAVTLGVRAIPAGGRLDGGDRGVWFGWLTDGDMWSRSVEVASGWLLNVALFIPAGLFVALATRRPTRTLLGLVGLSLLVESVQSFGLLGAPDPADLVANSLGAATGVSVGAIALRLFPDFTPADEARSSRWGAILIGAAAVAAAGICWLGLLAGADARRESLANELQVAFGETTSVDIAAKVDSENGYEQLLAATRTRPGYLGRVGETDQFEGRYSTEFFGFHRCVFVRWTPDGIILREGSGDECTVFREHPPGT